MITLQKTIHACKNGDISTLKSYFNCLKKDNIKIERNRLILLFKYSSENNHLDISIEIMKYADENDIDIGHLMYHCIENLDWVGENEQL